MYPKDEDRHNTITNTPRHVINAESLYEPSPSIVPSPAKTSPFTKCMNDDIAAGPLTASQTVVNGENHHVIDGNANHCTRANTTPSIIPHAKIRSATSRAASTPPAARADGTSAAAVLCILK